MTIFGAIWKTYSLENFAMTEPKVAVVVDVVEEIAIFDFRT